MRLPELLRRLAPALAPALVAACGGGSGAPATAPSAPRQIDFTQVTAALERTAAARGLRGVALVVVTRDAVLYEHGVGAIGPTTPVPIGSASKWLSGAVIGALVGEGRMTLDETVGARILDAPAPARGATLRQLYAHTSGMPSVDGDGAAGDGGCLADRTTTLAACAAQLLALPLLAAPGEVFTYGGASMMVAARMAEVATGSAWTALFETRVRAPLGLVATTFGAGANPRVSGGAVSTGREYGRFLQMWLGDGALGGRRVLPAGIVAEMERDQTAGARIGFSPHARYGDGERRYGIGLWRDRVAAGGRALQVSSQGAFGFSPWVDRERGIAGVVVVQDELARVYASVEEVQGLVRAAVDAARR